jgi:multidrug efflux pump subunit AcrA (membrane-fusion protein)
MKPGTRKFVLIPGIIATALAIAFGLSQLRPEPPEREERNPGLLVEVMPLEVSSERFQIRSQGTIRPRTQTILSAEISGSIVSISPTFIAGGVFAQDDVLMRIDPTNYTVAVDKSEALVKQRRIEYDGAAQLRSQGYRAESELASAAANLAAAQAELVGARRNLERTYIRLPYEGMVLSKEADIGQFVSVGTRLGVVFATDRAEVRLPLTDQDLGFVDLPLAAEISGAGAGSGPLVELTAIQRGQPVTWDATIVRSEGVVDERSRVTYAVAEILDPYQRHGNGVPLPIGGADQLLVVDDENRIQIRTVTVLRSDTQFAYISSGVVAGERIAITAIEAPVNGMPVRTIDTAATAMPVVREGVAASGGSEASRAQ